MSAGMLLSSGTYTSKRLKIPSFDLLCWADPDDSTSIHEVTKWLRSLSHSNYLYPEEEINPTKPPNIRFVPEIGLLNKLIESVAKHPGQTEKLRIKFCDF